MAGRQGHEQGHGGREILVVHTTVSGPIKLENRGPRYGWRWYRGR